MIQRGKLYAYYADGWDVFDPKNRLKVPEGTVVRVMRKSPHGCPKQGTMGHWFVEDPGTAKFIGLACSASLKPYSINVIKEG